MRTSGTRQAKPPFKFREMLGVIWTQGDGISRALVAFTFIGYVIPALPAVWLFLGFPREVEWALGLVWITGALYLGGFNEGVFTSKIWRETVRRGWAKPNEAYYLKLAEYLDRYGRNGRDPSDVALTAGFWVLWYSLMGLAVLFSVTLLPVLGGLTPYVFFAGVNLPVTFAALFAERWRTRKGLRLATLRGYPLEALFPGGIQQSDVAK